MKLNRYCKLEKAVRKDRIKNHRFATDKIKLDAEAGLAIATDGRVLAAVKAEFGEGEKGGLLEVENFKLAKKPSNLVGGDIVAGILEDNRAHLGLSIEADNSDCGEFPDYSSVMPKERDNYVKICVSPKLLVNLIEALGAINPKDPAPMLEIGVKVDDEGKAECKPISLKYKENIGVIMPLASIEEGK